MADILEALDVDAREADAATDERRHVVPGAEVDIGIGQEQPFRLAARVFIGGSGAVEIYISEPLKLARLRYSPVTSKRSQSLT